MPHRLGLARVHRDGEKESLLSAHIETPRQEAIAFARHTTNQKFSDNSHNILFRQENAIGFLICLITYTSNSGTTVTN